MLRIRGKVSENVEGMPYEFNEEAECCGEMVRQFRGSHHLTVGELIDFLRTIDQTRNVTLHNCRTSDEHEVTLGHFWISTDGELKIDID